MTLRTSKAFDELRATFRDRLGALGRAQDLLFRMKEGGRVTFDELVNTELAAQPIRVGENGSVTLDGPKGVRLRSGTVQPLAMAPHELVTNAVKYGAPKQRNGHPTIRWGRRHAKGESPGFISIGRKAAWRCRPWTPAKNAGKAES